MKINRIPLVEKPSAAAVLLFLGISAWLYISTPKNESSIVNSRKEPPAVTVPSKTNPVDKEEAIQKSSLADNNTNTEKNSLSSQYNR